MFRGIRRILTVAISLVIRYHRHSPLTSLESALFDSIRYTVRRFFRARHQEVLVYGAP